MPPAALASRSVVQSLYGIRIRTPWPVDGVAVTDEAWDVEFVAGDSDLLMNAASYVPAEQASRWAQYAALPDGSSYRRWTDLFEFLVTPDARQIHARSLRPVQDEAMLAYLLVDALSFSMVRLGCEPLHATAVSTGNGVAAFLGNSGGGKSTLAAAFIQGGCRLLTDDMLVITRHSQGWVAQPGPPRIKLYRDMADNILGAVSDSIPMNAVTDKLIIPLQRSQSMTEPAPLTTLYVLNGDSGTEGATPLVQRLSPAAAFPRVLAHTAGHYPSEPARLTRQFDFATALVRDIPVKTLSYRRRSDELFTVRDAILRDLSRSTG
jgi:hypothetical protein